VVLRTPWIAQTVIAAIENLRRTVAASATGRVATAAASDVCRTPGARRGIGGVAAAVRRTERAHAKPVNASASEPDPTLRIRRWPSSYPVAEMIGTAVRITASDGRTVSRALEDALTTRAVRGPSAAIPPMRFWRLNNKATQGCSAELADWNVRSHTAPLTSRDAELKMTRAERTIERRNAALG